MNAQSENIKALSDLPNTDGYEFMGITRSGKKYCKVIKNLITGRHSITGEATFNELIGWADLPSGMKFEPLVCMPEEENTAENLIEVGTKLAQELQDILDDAHKAGSDLPGVQALIDEWETAYQQHEPWQNKITDSTIELPAGLAALLTEKKA